ncbi:MAG: Ig-like domain-containing protein [Clostridia bacterium]|nr:Ig-like domain-containing protein [Clostridia bacterium]
MKRISKRVLAAVVTLCMLVSLVPMASAADALFSKTLPESGVYEVQAGAANGKFSSAGTGVTYDASTQTYNFSTTDTNNSLRYDTSTSIKGIGTSADVTDGAITLEFDIAFTSAENPRYTSTIFTAQSVGVLFIYGNELRLGTDTAIGTFAADGDAETEETVVPSGRVSLTFDVDAKTVTGSYAGGEAKTVAWNASKFRVFTFQLSNSVITGADAQEELKYAVGNFTYARIRGEAPTMTSSMENGATGVGLNPTITLTMSSAIDATGNDLSKIVLTDNVGNTVETSKTISGSSVIVAPVNSLAEATAYTLTVGADAVKVLNAGNAEAAYSFTTEKTAPGKINFAMNFDNFEEGVGAGTVAAYIKSDSNYGGSEYTFVSGYTSFGGVAVENANGENTAITNGTIDADDYIKVENGVLHIKSTTTANSVVFRLNTPTGSSTRNSFNSGYLRVKFNMGFKYNPSSSSSLATIGNNWYYPASISGGKGRIAFAAASWLATAQVDTQANMEAAPMYEYELLIDLDNKTVATEYAGIASYTADTTHNAAVGQAFDQISFSCPTNIGDLYLDNFSVQHIDTPAITASVADEAENVSTASPIQLTSPIAVADSYWDGVTLVGATSGDADFTIVPDGTGYGAKLKINTALGTNEDYTLSYPAVTNEGILDIDMAADSITFTTSATAETLYVSDYTIPAVAAGQNMAASATFGYAGSGSQTVMVGFGLYGAGDVLLKAAYTEYTFTEAGSQTVTANFTAPNEIAPGAYVKVFAWKGGVAAMQPICAPLG